MIKSCHKSLVTLLSLLICVAMMGMILPATAFAVEDNTMPIVTEPLTLTCWAPFPPNAGALMQSFAENEVNIYKEQLTGIKIDWTHPAVGEEVNAYNLMIASLDLPDMIFNYGTALSYPGGGEKAVADGVFLRLNEMIDEHAPNFLNVVNSSETLYKQTRTDSGLVYNFPMLETEEQPAFQGPVIRKELLEELNLSVPTTISEWYDTLTKIKEAHPEIDAPYFMYFDGMGYSMVRAYNTMNGWYNKDGVATYGYVTPEFKEYLSEMNKWYSEGLIQQDFAGAANHGGYVSALSASISEAKTAAWEGEFWMFAIQEAQAAEKGNIITIQPIKQPGTEPGVEPKLRVKVFNNRGFDLVITSACKNPVEAVRWVDWNYSEEGYYRHNYGEEGKTYTLVDGKAEWTDFMLKNPDGFDLNMLMNKYSYQNGPYVRDWRATFVSFSDVAASTTELWAGDTSYCMPQVYATVEEGTVIANTMTDIDTYCAEMTVKFINGDESLDNFDSFVQQVNDMGLEAATAAYQAQIDRYNAR